MYKLLRLLTTLFFVSAMSTTLLCMDLNIFYVGQGSFSMLQPLNKDVKSALIYDCGYDGGSSWIVPKNLVARGQKEQVMVEGKKDSLIGLFQNIDNVFIVISHDDSDHYCLLPFLIKDVICNKYIHLFARDDYLTKFGLQGATRRFSDANNSQDVIGFQSKIAGSFEIFSFDFKIPPTFANKNDMSIVLKVTYNTQNHGKQAILFTGDASKKTLDNLALDDDFWKDIRVFIAPHHGSNCNQELEWAEKVIEKSKQTPVVTIISSHPAYQDRFPDLDTVAKLYKYYNADNNSNIDDTDTHAVPCFFTSAKVDFRRFTNDIEDISAASAIYNYEVNLNLPIFVTGSLFGTDTPQQSYNVIIDQTVSINGEDINTAANRGVFDPSPGKANQKSIQNECLKDICGAIRRTNNILIDKICGELLVL